MSLAYARERIQFDRPICSLQAIQFYCVDMSIDVDASRFISYKAPMMFSEGLSCDHEVSIAKAWISEAYKQVTALVHQIHAAIGFTEDHDLHMYLKRARTIELWPGNADYHRERIARAVLN